MNDTAIKNFCLEARHMLEQQVQQCAVKYGIVEEGAPAPDAVAVGEVALTELQRSQRAQLLELQAGIGHEELCAAPPTPGSTAWLPSASWR